MIKKYDRLLADGYIRTENSDLDSNFWPVEFQEDISSEGFHTLEKSGEYSEIGFILPTQENINTVVFFEDERGALFINEDKIKFNNSTINILSNNEEGKVYYVDIYAKLYSQSTYSIVNDPYINRGALHLSGSQVLIYEKEPSPTLPGNLKRFSIKARRVGNTGAIKIGIMGYINSTDIPLNLDGEGLYKNYYSLPITQYTEDDYSIYSGYIKYGSIIGNDAYISSISNLPTKFPIKFEYFSLVIEVEEDGEFYVDYVEFRDVVEEDGFMHIEVEEEISESQIGAGGFVQIFDEDWKMQQSRLKKPNDRFFEVKKC